LERQSASTCNLRCKLALRCNTVTINNYNKITASQLNICTAAMTYQQTESGTFITNSILFFPLLASTLELCWNNDLIVYYECMKIWIHDFAFCQLLFITGVTVTCSVLTFHSMNGYLCQLPQHL